MSDFYARMAATATRLLALRGQPVACVHYGPPTPDDSDGSVTVSETAITLSGVLVPYTEKNTGNKFGAEAGTGQGSEMKLILAPVGTDGTAVTFEFQAGDTAVANGLLWRMVEAMPINPAGTIVAFICRVVRG